MRKSGFKSKAKSSRSRAGISHCDMLREFFGRRLEQRMPGKDRILPRWQIFQDSTAIGLVTWK